MPTITGRTYKNERVEIDGTKFVRCKFENCEMVYSATGAFDVYDCDIGVCTWVFEGGANLTMQFLTYMYALSPQGLEYVESCFQTVRDRGTPPRAAPPGSDYLLH